MRVLAASAVVIALASAAGCGGGSSTPTNSNGEASKSANQVLADALKAGRAATYVHVSGHLPAGPHQETFDLTLKVGEGATGSFVIDGDQKVELLAIGLGVQMPCPTCKSYMRGNAAFWKYNGPVAGVTHWQRLVGKWVEFSPDNFVLQGYVLHFADLNSYFGILTSHLRATTQAETAYKGHSVVAVYGPSKIEEVYVAATGKPYPALIAVHGMDSASVSFDHWNEPVSLTAPSGAIPLPKTGG